MSENQFPDRPPADGERPAGGGWGPPPGMPLGRDSASWQPPAAQPAPGQPAGAPYGHMVGGPYQGPMVYQPPPRPVDLLDPKGRRIWRLPAVSVDYQHVLRGRGFAWWKPLVALAFLAVTFLAAQILIGLLFLPVVLITGAADFAAAVRNLDFNNPWLMLLGLVSLAVLIPLSLATVRLVFGVPAGFLSSVVGRFRWRWAAQVTAVTLPLWIIYLAVMTLLSGGLTFDPPENWWLIASMVVLLVPFQAAGEEYAFRGIPLQVVGSWFRSRWLALVVPGIASTALFALAHGSLDPLILLDLAAFAALAVYLTWRTGGLEAAVVVHTVNNVLVFLLSTAAGDLGQQLVQEDTTQSWPALGFSVLLDLAAAVVITLLARRVKPQRSYQPRPVPPPAARPHLPGPWPWGTTGHPQYIGAYRQYPPAQSWQPDGGVPECDPGARRHPSGLGDRGDRRVHSDLGGADDTAQVPFPSRPRDES